MRRDVTVLAACFLASAGLALADVPVIQPGECLYLTGAPVGAPAAADEVLIDGSEIVEHCGAFANVGTRADGSHSAQVHIEGANSGPPSGGSSCHVASWIGHAFRIPAAAPGSIARIDVAGGIQGTALRVLPDSSTQVLRVILIVEEIHPITLAAHIIASEIAYDWPSGHRHLQADSAFQRSVTFRASGDNQYQVRLLLESTKDYHVSSIDFGPPGTGRGAWYDSLEVCVEPDPEPPIPPEDPRIDDLELADLELRLYNKECLPRVWMPAAQTGRLEAARQLVSDRIVQATATNDPNVNSRLATQKLAAADADIASGHFQRACRSLSDSLRALSTP